MDGIIDQVYCRLPNTLLKRRQVKKIFLKFTLKQYHKIFIVLMKNNNKTILYLRAKGQETLK